ncbi:1,4-butanediol diacrylate esterase [Mesorhizobium tianshanense]|nr:1,4-butanediol diacrylate esterase [Mesorhizobium tianshanense]
MNVDSVFWIASMTKAITAAAAMQLVEQAKLSLDEPIGGLLPDLASPKVLEGFDKDGTPKLRPAKGPITLRQLMTHTSGFCYDMWNADMVRYMEHTQNPGIISCENKALTIPLTSDPGTRWEYGIGIDFVGKAVEATSGKALGSYLQDNMFSPLGMTDTSFKLRDDQRKRLVALHARSSPNSFDVMPFEIPQEPEFEMGGGGLYGTASDYGAFIRMLLNRGKINGNQVLKPETVDLMGQNNMGGLNMTKMHSAIPAVTNNVDFYTEQDKKWGLSFMINTQKTKEGRNPGGLAGAGLANTYFWVDPTAKVGGLVMTQILPFADPHVLPLFAGFEKAVYESL